MKITGYNNNLYNFASVENNKAGTESSKKPDSKKKFLDKIQTSVRNSADMNDLIQVPRTIFKGYLAFFTSTTLMTLAMFAQNKHKKLATGMNIASALIALWGTYCFVRPFIIKSNSDIKTNKEKNN